MRKGLLYFFILLLFLSGTIMADWVVEEDIDPITDEKQIMLKLPCEDSIESVFKRNAIIIRKGYRNDVVELLLRWDKKLEETDVTIRFDDDEPYKESWSPSKETRTGDALFFPRLHGDLEKFLAKIIIADNRLVMRPEEPSMGRPIPAVFDIGEVEQVLKDYIYEWELEKVIEVIENIDKIDTENFTTEEIYYKTLYENVTFDIKDILTMENNIRSVDFSSDDSMIVAGVAEEVKVWKCDEKTEEYERFITFKEHNDSVLSTTFSSNDNLVVSSAKDGAVKVWELDKNTGSYEIITTFEEHDDSVFSAVF